ncbi:MAG: M42 family metallopeptidase [Candidatus Cloacimonetes bacterium]|nr:M42 family metallopeptidase [Candidatus Cloacimonadota bacterium]
MNKDLKKLFRDLVEAPSPSGFEQPAQKIFADFVRKYVPAEDVNTDVHGNVIALRKGKGNIRLMISGHADEIGLMVTYIDDNGYLYFAPIGGVDPAILPGIRVDIHHEGKVVRGVVGRKAIHMMTSDEMSKAPKIENLWIDIAAKNKKDAQKRVAIGDVITFSAGMEILNGDIITTKASDNKAGVFVAAATLHYLDKEKIDANVYAVSSVQEEIGLRGAKTSAYGIDPHVGIAVDVTFATDYPDTDKKKFGEVFLEKGPVLAIGANINSKVLTMLKQAAKNKKIDVQFDAAPRATGTDANAIQINRSGVATGLVSIPNRYMHTPSEIISLKDLDEAAVLLAEFARLLNDSSDFIPSI